MAAPDVGVESVAAGFERAGVDADGSAPMPAEEASEPEPLPLPPAVEPEAEDEGEAEAGGLPDLADDAEFEGALESILLVVDSPIAEEQLAGVLDQSVKRVTAALRRLSLQHVVGEDAVDGLLREGVLVDLYDTVRNSLRISENSSSDGSPARMAASISASETPLRLPETALANAGLSPSTSI